jgi:CheY-like chemotaxis protein
LKYGDVPRECALESPQEPGPTVLVVEDDAIIRLSAVEHLKDEGFVVLEAGSGEAALCFLDTDQRIDLLFTDIRLGDKLNGWDVGEAFRVRFPNIAVLYTSGNSISPPRNVDRSRFFAKPYEPGKIAGACRELFADRNSNVRSILRSD